MSAAGPVPEGEGVDPELEAAVESAFEEVPRRSVTVSRTGLLPGRRLRRQVPGRGTCRRGGEPRPLSQARAEAAQAAEDLARARADLYNLQQEYQGFVRRSREAAAGHRQAGAAGVVEALIPVLDEVELARQHGDLTGTFETTATKLEAVLRDKFSLERFGAEGEPFDPTIHEALMATESEEVTEPTIVLVLQPGYRLGERVVRAARVQVANPA
ncbi:nucleotide exchange factor GrpE [Actinomyces lilanjuaniae]|uniref:Protein GrpE n=1 Tax=Actinomyces lilanjuaniae TaxID=2321394 RepID=A0ABM6Z651_9ACTO|nr:nucleotide exchange factor GrpE [Actinomyces lilanjuaniae]AYD90505.1 nucleotide exchange factor GrpE [Actinomyces lilanjuaniae]